MQDYRLDFEASSRFFKIIVTTMWLYLRSILKWLGKFLVEYLFNKELSSVSHKNVTKKYSIE